MKSLFNRQAERFVRERKRYKRWMALFLCLAIVVSSGTYTSMTREGRALDESTEPQADSTDVADVTSETGGGSSNVDTIIQEGGQRTDADEAAGSGLESANGVKESDALKADSENGANAGNDASGSETDADKIPDGENPEQDSRKDIVNQDDPDGADANTKATVSEGDPTTTEEEIKATVTDNDPVALTTLQGIIDAYEKGELNGPAADGLWRIEGDSLVITMDRDYEEALYIPKGIKAVLDLAGHTLGISDSGISNNGIDIFGEFVLRDSSNGSGSVRPSKEENTGVGGVYIEQRASFVMEGGTISGFSTDRSGAGVFIGQNATFTMSGGSIVENTTRGAGGAIYVKTGGNVALNSESITISNNHAENGGAIAFEGQPGQLEWSGISLNNNSAVKNGGAIYINKTAVIKLTDAHFSGNTAENGGAIYVASVKSEVAIEKSEMAGNTASENGGAVYTSGTGASVIIKGSAITGNKATGRGGVLYTSGSNTAITIEDSVITENTATGRGGVICSSDTSINTVITVSGETRFERNEGSDGAAIMTEAADSQVKLNPGVVFKDNTANGHGGAVALLRERSRLTADGVLFEGNFTKRGGGAIVVYDIAKNSEVTLINSRLTKNVSAGSNAGAVGLWGPGTLTIDHCVIEGNETAARGGGVYMAGASNLRSYFYLKNGSKVVNNRITGTGSTCYGGGICLYNCVTASIGDEEIADMAVQAQEDGGYSAGGSVEISGNKNAYYGGGIYLGERSQLHMEDTKVSGNKASNGGGIYHAGMRAKSVAETDVIFELVNVDITDNTAADWGGGLYAGGGHGSISGGNISGNNAGGYGGGIFKRYAGDIKVTDNARITGNTTTGRLSNSPDGYGGGVFLWGGGMTLTKGEISDNYARRGGGVAAATWENDRTYASDTYFKITSGSIYDNTSELYGDDILVARQTRETAEDGTVSYARTASVSLPAARSLKADKKTGTGWQEEIWVVETHELKEETGNPKEIPATEKIEKANSETEYDYCYTFLYPGRRESGTAVSVTIDGGKPTIYASVKKALEAVRQAQEEKAGAAATITLLKNVRESVVIPGGMTVTLDLDGHTLANQGKNSTVKIEAGANLTIDDTAGGGRITGSAPERLTYGTNKIYAGLMVDGEATLKKGTICDYYPVVSGRGYCTGVYISQSGTFTMEQDGKIIGNGGDKRQYANGVVINFEESYGSDKRDVYGKFVMNGGEISNNYRAIYTDGNDDHRSSVTVSSATITDNGSSEFVEDKGGFAMRLAYCDASVTDTTITGTKGRYTGNTICLSGKTVLSLTGSTISENDIGKGNEAKGGGLYVDSGCSAVIKDTNFTGNTAQYGGAVYSAGSLELKGTCNITGNKAGTNGGAVYSTGTVKAVEEGAKVSITGNSAGSYGGGLYFGDGHTGDFDRAEIYENTAFAGGNDIYAMSKKAYTLPKAPESGEDAAYIKWRDENATSSRDRYLGIEGDVLKAASGKTYSLTAAKSDEVIDGEVAKVVSGETEERFDTIAGAVEAATGSESAGDAAPVIYLLKDVTQERAVEIAQKKSVTIDLNGYTVTSGANQIFSVRGNLTIQDTTGDKNHNSQSGAKGTLTLSESRTNGRAVYVYKAGALTVKGGSFTGFRQSKGGAVYAEAYSEVRLEGGSFENNEATGNSDGDGGAIYTLGQTGLTIGDHVIFRGNSAAHDGGAVWCNTGDKDLSIGKAVFEGNTSGHSGGAIYTTYAKPVTLNGAIFRENTASGWLGGALALYNADTITINGGLFEKNAAVDVGGAIYATGYKDLTIDEGAELRENAVKCVVANHISDVRGGALYVSDYSGTTWIKNAVFERNTAESGGGAIASNICGRDSQFIVEKDVVIKDNCTNSSSNGGGGIYIFGGNSNSNFTINGAAISGNTAAEANGGGVYVNNIGKISINGGTISGNTAGGTGGGIYSYNNANVQMTGGVICENQAKDAAGMYIWGKEANTKVALSGGEIRDNIAGDRGGGVYASTGTKTTVNGTTITGNSAGNRGGGAYIVTEKLEFELIPGGKLYGNAAGEGADLYAAYSRNIEGRRVYVTKAAEMFSEEETMKAAGWLDETTGKTFEGPNNYAPPRRAYALTLLLARNGEPVAKIGEKEYYTLQSAIDAVRGDNTVAQGSEIVMIRDIVETVEVPVGTEAVLNLNGHKLTGQTRAINCKGKLTIRDEKKGSELYPEGTGVGTITGHTMENGGAILVENAGQVRMEGGRIFKSSAAEQGGAVYINNGTFELAGNAEITECYAKSAGSAVSGHEASSVFRMTGGKILKNVSDDVGALYLTAGAKGFITGGEISENKALNGAAIYLSVGADVSILGSSKEEPVIIRGNKSSRNDWNGGGAIHVYMDSKMTIGNARITENSTKNLGGAIYFGGGNMTIAGGTVIEKNSAIRGGAVYQDGGTLYMTGGRIGNNRANYGGGIAQTYNKSMIFIMSGGLLAGNYSTATGIGNDFYSMYEGAKPGVSPDATLMRAKAMDGGVYKTWHDDTFTMNEEGSDREDSTISKGEYLVGSINESDNLALTAAKYRLEDEVVPETDVAVKGIIVDSISDGTVDHSDARAEEIKASEKNAAQMLVEDPDNFKITDKIYRTTTDEKGNTKTEYMIEGTVDGVTRLYEPSQAVLWSKGNDADKDNRIVRSYDSISYTLSIPLKYDGLDDGTEKDPSEDESGSSKKDKLQLWVSADIPYGSDKAGFSGNGGMKLSYIENRIDEKGVYHQILTGYYEIDNDPGQAVGKTISLTAYGMKNGETIKPVFSAWIAGNKRNTENPETAAADTVTVSATKSYNVSLERNSELEYTGYFDLDERRELSVQEYNEAKADPERHVVYGTLLGYGVTLEMRNTGTNSGVKGIEAPEETFRFNVDMAANMYLDGVPLGGRKAPYFWAYRENDDSVYGRDQDNKNSRVRMNWNDEDDVNKTTSYAFGSTPRTTSLFNAGSWNLDSYETIHSIAEGDGTAETVNDGQLRLHFSVSNYGLAPNLSAVTAKNKAISAGYIQIICPIDDSYKSAVTGNQFLSVTQDVVASSFSWDGITPADVISGDDEEDMMNLIDFFGMGEYKNYAVNETQYKDNFRTYELGMMVSGSGDGISKADSLIKVNDFLKGDGSGFNQSANGLANTPLGTDVYITGRVDYYSGQYDTTDPSDPYYNAVFLDGEDNKIERNYMTSLNILQKFDADVFTPAGTPEPVIGKTYTANGKIENGAFYAYSNEGAIIWDQSSNPKTKRFKLTVLYAAKRDGENWEKVPRTVSGQGTEVINTDDGGAADMERTHEKDLIYYTTLADLQKDGKKCVGILYEVRDCCIRSGHYVKLGCKANVIKDFNKTGETYCTTNEVRTFSTYRPAYKEYYGAHKAESGFSMENSGLLNTFSWADEKFAEGNHYAAREDAGDKDILTTGNENTGNPGKLYVRYAEKLSEGYGKTEYSHGLKVAGTHGSPYLGNSILLYTLNSGISITNTDLKSGSNKRKENYDLGQRERTVNYKVKPELGISSSVKDYDLVTNGTQSAQVTVTLELPQYINYNEGSLRFDYKACKATERDMNWSAHVEKGADGRSVVTLTTNVADIDLGLPEITYNCTLGKPGSSDDVPPNTVLTVVASIRTEYKGSEYGEGGRLADVTRSDSISIKTVGSSTEVIWTNVDDDKYNKLVDIGDDLVYTLHYENKEQYPISNVSMLNVLPYAGDSEPNGRKSDFTGGYQVKTVEFIFQKEESYNAFCDSNGVLKWTDNATVAMHDKQTNTADWKVIGTPISSTDGKYSVTYNVADSTIVQHATDTTGKAIYGLIPSVASEEEVVIKLTLSPKAGGSGAYITDVNGKTQQGLQLYYNNFGFWSGETQPNEKAVESMPVYIKTVKRSLTGTVWMDQDQSGTYVKTESVPTTTDRPIGNVTVSLYTTDEEHALTGGANLQIGDKVYRPAKDINGTPVAQQRTNEKGEYTFENLAAGTYFVFISDENSGYQVQNGENPALGFRQLSVTPDRDTKTYGATGATATDKAVPYYNVTLGGVEKTAVNVTAGSETGVAGLVGALISNGEGTAGAGIQLPAVENISDADYYSPNWNCGFYYMTQNIEKRWEQMSGLKEKVKKGVPAGASLIVTEKVTGENDHSAYGSYSFTMKQSENDAELDTVTLTGTYPAAEEFVLENFKVARDDNKGLIIWSIKDIPLQAETGGGGSYSQKLDYGFTFEEKARDGKSLVGYIVDEGEREISGSTIDYKITNTKIVLNIALKKISTENDWDGEAIPLGGATYKVYRSYNGNKASNETNIAGTSADSGDSLGILYLKGLEEGDYYIVETAAPKGYAIDETVYHVNITYPQEGGFNPNKPKILAEAMYSNGTTKKLAEYSMNGAETLDQEYEVTLAKTPELPEGSTDADKSAAVGTYTCYSLGFVVKDACIYKLPSTGGIGIFPFAAAGTLLLMAAVWLMMRKRREEVL